MGTWPVNDTFSDADGTQFCGAGTAVDGSNYTVRTSTPSGSKMLTISGNVTQYGIGKITAGRAYFETFANNPVNINYLDDSGTLQNDQVSAVFAFFTNANQTYIALTVHTYFQLRYYFANQGSYVAGNWYIVDAIDAITPKATFNDPSRFTFGTAGNPVIHTISYKLTGDQPSTTGFTAEVIVNGVTLGWSPNFTTPYNPVNLRKVGWGMWSVSTLTTGIHLDSLSVLPILQQLRRLLRVLALSV
jgi:hypothetical protein